LALLTTRFFVIDFYRIPQNGMFPGLPAGSRVFANKLAYSDASQVKRGDIVVFRRVENGRRYNYIWRVVGLPGEKVEVSKESLVVNGQPARHQRLREQNGNAVFREEFGGISYEVAFDSAQNDPPPNASVTVPPDHFFVLGDNRLNARDSRVFGPVPFSSIIAKKL